MLRSALACARFGHYGREGCATSRGRTLKSAAASLQSFSDEYSQAIAARILNPNECRSFENLPPYKGGEEYLNPNISTEIPPPIQRNKPQRVAA